MTVKNKFVVHIPSFWLNNDSVQSGLKKKFFKTSRNESAFMSQNIIEVQAREKCYGNI